MIRARVLSLALVIVACGSGSDGVESNVANTRTDSRSSTDDLPLEQNFADPNELRRFVVSGVEVYSRSTFESLPEQATRVEFTTLIIDDGKGPTICLGGADGSLPPQCSGLIADGIVFDESWADTQQSTTWGSRTVVVSWPPISGRVDVVSQAAPAPRPSRQTQAPSLPDECLEIDSFVPIETLQAWAESHPTRVGVAFSWDGGRTGGLQIVGELDEVRNELRTADATPCLVQVMYSHDELVAAQTELLRNTDLDFAFVTGSGSGNIENRLNVSVAVADRSTSEILSRAVIDPAMLRITGDGVILR